MCRCRRRSPTTARARSTFEIDLSKDADIAALKGKQLTATIVSDKGQSEATFPLQ